MVRMEEVAASLGVPVELLSLLPDLLVDLPELGTSSSRVVEQLKKLAVPAGARVLDLGCGKGAVAVALAQELGLRVDGVDGMVEFVRAAERLATARGVAPLCRFRWQDLHDAMVDGIARPHDVVLFLGMGRALGSLETTVLQLRRCVRPDGLMVIEDAFAAAGYGRRVPGHEDAPEHEETLRQLTSCGDAVVAEELASVEEMRATNARVREALQRRGATLTARNPGAADMLRAYLARHDAEARLYENEELLSATWVLRRGQ